MVKSTSRTPLTVRLDPESKRILTEQAELSGLDVGVAARQILELYIQRLRAGADYVDTLAQLKAALKNDSEAA